MNALFYYLYLIMHEKLLTSIGSLKNWSDKILSESTRDEWRLNNFVSAFNISDYQKFYKELLPFVKNLRVNEHPMIKTLVETYEHNTSVLHEAMKENFLYEMLASVLLDVPAMGRKADDLINAIKEIKSNTENLEYTLTISYISS